MASEDTMSDMTGSASGSTFVITGGSSSGGTLLIAPATFSRTSLTASFRSRSRTKRTVILALPSLMRADMSRAPPADPFAYLQLARGEVIAPDHERPVHAVSVLHRRVRQRHHLIDA